MEYHGIPSNKMEYGLGNELRSTHLGGGEGHLLGIVVKQSAEVDEQTLGRLRSEEPHRRTLRSDRRLDKLETRYVDGDKSQRQTTGEKHNRAAQSRADIYFSVDFSRVYVRAEVFKSWG